MRPLRLLWLQPLALLLLCSVATAAPDLSGALDRVLAAQCLRGVTVGVVVQHLQGSVLYERNADCALIPASNMKLPTGALALRTWGDQYLFPAREHLEYFGKRNSTPECTGALLRAMNKSSNNYLADAFMAALLAAHQAKEYDELAQSAWQQRGLPMAGCVFDDGSGLSRRNRLTPRFLVALLQYMRGDSEWAGAFVDTLPVAAVDGTLRKRMDKTCAAGCVRAKTGFLTGVSTLSGYVDRHGRIVCFSVMMNGFGGSADPMRQVQNRVCAAIAENL